MRPTTTATGIEIRSIIPTRRGISARFGTSKIKVVRAVTNRPTVPKKPLKKAVQ
jgi:hypothetical protein